MSMSKVLETLQEKGPLSVKEIAANIFRGYCAALTSVQRLLRERPGSIHLYGYRGRTKIYAAGPAEDVDPLNGAALALSALENGEKMTMQEVADATGMTAHSVRFFFRVIRNEDLNRPKSEKRLRVVDWVKNPNTSGPSSPVFALGPGKDAPKPDWVARRRKREREVRSFNSRQARAAKQSSAPAKGVDHGLMFSQLEQASNKVTRRIRM